MTLENWLLLLLTCCGVCVVPGPNSIMVVNHVTRFGLKKALATIAGGMLGFIILMMIAVLGLGPFLKSEPEFILALKTVGSFYLAMIGVRLLWDSESHYDGSKNIKDGNHPSLFRQGFLSAILNINALLFFIAIMPNFLDPDASIITQAIECALTLAVCEMVVEFGFALLIWGYREKIMKSGVWFNRICGVLFFVFAFLLQFRNY